MSEEKEILKHFDDIFDTNTIKHVKLDMPLLKFFLKELEESFRKPSPRYERLRSKQIEISDRLYETINDNQKQLFNKYSQITNEMASVEDLQLFCFGYILAKELDKESKIEKK